MTYIILTMYGATAIVAGLFIGHLADLFKSRRTSLILALCLALVGTIMLAASTTLPVLYVGRVMQSIGGTAAWIVGFATLRAAIEPSNMGKTFGVIQSCVCIGAISGPAVAGVLLDLIGYWPAWGAVVFVLALDIGMRLVMLEKDDVKAHAKPARAGAAAADDIDDEEAGENRALLSGRSAQSYSGAARGEPAPAPEEPSMLAFYRILFAEPRVIVALLCSIVYAGMLASYNTTIPTHVHEAFGWGSLPTGLLFTSQQGPAILLAPICGWFRDKYGTKLPAGLGFALLGPFLWLLGAADLEQFPWAATLTSAKRTYVIALLLAGCVTNLTSSVAPIEITRVVTMLQQRQPGIFGPNGGYSRCYSLTNVVFSTGLTLGPLLSGGLADSVGYYYMNCVLACICVVMSVLAFAVLEGRVPQ
ncbi:putative MFS-type transporter [Escovopsis weberi]|uniref:Putative MFS-type transporter n=1 Tax=Escovopsis weberi TaxID=150374 RepID=A0A0M9VX48_ESCWE|nr:putative MFS-type transporter [Escovopsis weberi]